MSTISDNNNNSDTEDNNNNNNNSSDNENNNEQRQPPQASIKEQQQVIDKQNQLLQQHIKLINQQSQQSNNPSTPPSSPYNATSITSATITNTIKKSLELNQMINSFITSKSLKNLNIKSCLNSIHFHPNDYYDGNGDHEIFVNNINETIEYYSNLFKPLFSELNTSIERIEFDCMGLLNINTFSNLLNNKSIKYLYLYGNSDFIVYSSKPSYNGGGGGELHKEFISVNQYLFDNIFTSPLTSIRHYKINIKEPNQLKLIFNLILNNISTQQQQQEQQQKSNNITLKEIKIEIKRIGYIRELNINNPYFKTMTKRIIE
ncbi:hypothetical protein ACTFIW_011070 [Dictyostelium discoideum]